MLICWTVAVIPIATPLAPIEFMNIVSGIPPAIETHIVPRLPARMFNLNPRATALLEGTAEEVQNMDAVTDPVLNW